RSREQMTKVRKETRARLVGRERVNLPVASLPRTAARTISNDSLSQRVYQALKRDIITGVHQPGEALSEKDLAEKYASSRTPVREAAVRLQHDNLLRVVPNRGYFITKISVQDLVQLYEYRAAVECACAELAATKSVNLELRDRLEKLAHTEYKVDHRESYIHFITADTAFHVG